MNARTALNLGLAAALAAAALVWWLKPWKPAQDDAQTFALVAAAPEQLRRIEIQRRGGDAIVLDRIEQQWQMTAPLRARLDEIQLGRILELVQLRPSTRLPAVDLARFELDQPWAQIRFDRHAIDFGALNELTRELYLRSAEHVYVVPQRLAAAVPSNAAKLLAHRMFGPQEAPVAFTLATFSLRHDGTHWQLDPPDPGLSQDDLVRWVERWRHAGSVVTQPGSGREAAERISVELRDARKIEFAVLARTPDLVLLRNDEAVQYHLPAHFAQTLLTSPSAAGAPSR
jgi:hypothetical protein